MHDRRRDRLIAWALALLAVLDVAALAPFLDRRAAAAVFYDDAFYYFQIARNVARGPGFTFDGVHATSGFHPLWLLAQVPLFRSFAGDLAPLRAVLLLEAALVAAATVIVFRVLRPRIGRAPAAVAALVLLAQPGAMRILRGGVEGALALCLFTMVWARWLVVRDDVRAPLRRWWALGGGCALFFLARLEAAVAVAVLLALAWPRLRERWARAVALVLPACASALLYLAWTRWSFGTWGPVSALAKTRLGGEAWTHQSWSQRLSLLVYIPWTGEPYLRRLLGALGVNPLAVPAVGTALFLALCALAVWQRHRLLPRLPRSGAAFVVATAAAMMVIDKVSVRLMVDWYRAPSLLAVAILGGLLVAGRAALARLAAALLAVACVARAGQPLWPMRNAPAADPAGLQAADWLRPRLAAGALAGSWNAGLIGYFAGGGVVNLDGLVNDTAFLREVVRGGQLPAYLARERIRFLVDATTPEGRLAPLPRRYPPPVAAAVESQYRPVAAFTAACAAVPSCPVLAVWERSAGPGEGPGP